MLFSVPTAFALRSDNCPADGLPFSEFKLRYGRQIAPILVPTREKIKEVLNALDSQPVEKFSSIRADAFYVLNGNVREIFHYWNTDPDPGYPWIKKRQGLTALSF